MTKEEFEEWCYEDAKRYIEVYNQQIHQVYLKYLKIMDKDKMQIHEQVDWKLKLADAFLTILDFHRIDIKPFEDEITQSLGTLWIGNFRIDAIEESTIKYKKAIYAPADESKSPIDQIEEAENHNKDFNEEML
jgi:hypothetical protein